MTIFKPRCPALHPDNNSRCGREEGHDDPHRNFTEKEWENVTTGHDMEGGVTAAAIEKETRECLDPDAHWRIVEAFERAEKAEGEANTYKKLHRAGLAALEEAEQELTKPRTLTADDITDEMVERARAAYPGSDRPSLYRALIAALTEPPARPEGAEELEAELAGVWPSDRPGLTDAADLLATHGVRVTGDES